VTTSRVVSSISTVAAVAVSGITLATALFSQLSFEPTASAAFEERVGRALFGPTFLALGLSAVAFALLIATIRGAAPALGWISVALSATALVVIVPPIFEYRRALDPRPQLTKELTFLELGPDAPIVARSSRPLPDLPEVTWVFAVPLPRDATCARTRAAIERWADPGTVGEDRSYICQLHARRSGYRVDVGASPDYVTRPSSTNEVGDAARHYVLVTISASRRR
jgi:hypothetical protein